MNDQKTLGYSKFDSLQKGSLDAATSHFSNGNNQVSTKSSFNDHNQDTIMDQRNLAIKA